MTPYRAPDHAQISRVLGGLRQSKTAVGADARSTGLALEQVFSRTIHPVPVPCHLYVHCTIYSTARALSISGVRDWNCRKCM
jgi:hypothetical protein